jgi:nitrogenase-stabilizing/protective protein
MSNPLNDLHAAEDFFRFYQVPFNSKVVNVVRLHILKQFRAYLDEEKLLDANPNDPEVWEKQRRLLITAYRDFIHTSPLKPDQHLNQQNRPVLKLSKSACATCSTGCK